MPYNAWKLRDNSRSFVEKILKGHKKVVTFSGRSYNVFEIKRAGELPSITALFTDLYTVGQADVIEAQDKVENMNCFVTVSNYNGYTKDAKDYAVEQQIGLFRISEFMGALWKKDFWNYVQRDSRGNSILHYRGRSA